MIDIEEIDIDEVTDRFAALSPRLIKVINSEETLVAIRGVCARRGITDSEQVAAIEQVIGLMVVDLVKPEELHLQLATFADVDDPAAAKGIADEVIKMVFGLSGVMGDITRPEARPIAIGIERPVPAPMPMSSPTVQVPPKVPPAATPLAPMFMQKQTQFSPVHPPATDSSVSKFFAGFQKENTVVSQPAPAAAKVQLGNAPTMPVSGNIISTRGQAEIPRVVHYGSLKSILEKPPMPSSTTGANKSGPVSLEKIGTSLPGVRGVPPAPTPSKPPIQSAPIVVPRPPMPPPPPISRL